MSVFSQILKTIYAKLFPEESRRTFSEEPTRPLDAAALARALAGEGRRHVSTGYASYSIRGEIGENESLYLLFGNSDGLNALPDFGIAGVADSQAPEKSASGVSQVALSAFSNQIIQSAVLDFFELEGYEEAAPLQDMVINAMETAGVAVEQENPGVSFSLTAGLIFAEIIILGHRGSTKAYHLDRHHIEMITVGGWQADGDDGHQTISDIDSSSDEQPDQVMVFSRPVPRDGYILLCTKGVWKNIDEKDIGKIVENATGPQEGCDALINHAKRENPDQDASAILIYFPPDFGPWR